MVHIIIKVHINSVTHWFSNFSCIRITRVGGLIKPDCWAPPPEFDSVVLEWGHRENCLSNRLLHDIDDAGLVTTLWELLAHGT